MPVCAGSRALPAKPAATALPLLPTAALHAPAAPSPYVAPRPSPRLRRCRRLPPLLVPLVSVSPPPWPRPATTRTRTALAVDTRHSASPTASLPPPAPPWLLVHPRPHARPRAAPLLPAPGAAPAVAGHRGPGRARPRLS
nr:lysine-rich arabinogalactan protein 19-like [Aegilops tauschii subsp. strangulata]